MINELVKFPMAFRPHVALVFLMPLADVITAFTEFAHISE